MIHPRNGLRHDAVNMHKADEQNSMQFFFPFSRTLQQNKYTQIYSSGKNMNI